MSAGFKSLKQNAVLEKYFNILRFQNIFENSRHNLLEEWHTCVLRHSGCGTLP
jgi:hypothetical protein